MRSYGGKSEVYVETRVGHDNSTIQWVYEITYEKMLESDGTWQEKLAPVLDLIKRNPDAIVDDTSVEKLLSWLAEALNDESQRDLLLCRNQSVIFFLSNPPEILLSHPSCANFSLRLAGLIAGSDENFCEALIKNGCLENLFGNFNKLFLTNAVAKCAFFEGLSSVVESFTGLRWAADIPGLYISHFYYILLQTMPV